MVSRIAAKIADMNIKDFAALEHTQKEVYRAKARTILASERNYYAEQRAREAVQTSEGA